MRRTRRISRGAAALAAVVWAAWAFGGGAAATPAEPQPRGAATALRQAAGDRLLVGTAVMSRQLDDPKLAELVARQFNCLTAENEMKPQSLQPKKGKFAFAAADKIVAFAQAHDVKVVGHTLCWHEQSPAWMYQDEQKRPLPREQALENLQAHIDTVVEHFKGKVVGWDVVNEAVSDKKDEYLRDSPARRAIGDDFIAKAFEFARAADPNVELYYNDYSNENPDKREKTIRLIRDLKAKGVRIDGVGLQCHFAIRYSDTPRLLDEAIRAYGAEGVKVMITELDVDVLPRTTSGAEVAARETGGANPYADGLPPDVAAQQAEFYRKVMDVVMKYPQNVTRVTFWGTHDGTSWLNDWPVRGRTNHALLWDRKLEPKPAFTAVLQALAQTGSERPAHGRPQGKKP